MKYIIFILILFTSCSKEELCDCKVVNKIKNVITFPGGFQRVRWYKIRLDCDGEIIDRKVSKEEYDAVEVFDWIPCN